MNTDHLTVKPEKFSVLKEEQNQLIKTAKFASPNQIIINNSENLFQRLERISHVTKIQYNIIQQVTGRRITSNYSGNSEWFPTLEKYLDSGIDYREDYPYIQTNSLRNHGFSRIRTSYRQETVFYDIIHKKIKKSTDPLSSFENYSQYFDFTDKFVCFDNDSTTVIPHTSIYNAALAIFNNSYVFQSYKLVQWLLKAHAIEKNKQHGPNTNII